MAANVLSPWVGTWGVAQLANGNADYNGKTLREVVHTSIAGSSVRIQISNEFSDQPLSITDVHMALRSSGSSTQAGSDRQLRALLLSRFVDQKLTTFISTQNYEDLIVLTELIEAGKITPVIDRTYPLSEVPNAIRYLEQGHACGKIVITV